MLRRADGEILVGGSVDFICLNDRFVAGMTFAPASAETGDGSRSFIYEEGQDAAVFYGEPHYDEVPSRSNLWRSDGCGDEGSLKGFEIPLRNPKYRR